MTTQPGSKPTGTNETAEVSPSDIIFIPDGRFLSLRVIGKPASVYRISPEGVSSLMALFKIPDEINNRLSTETRASVLNDFLETESRNLNIILFQGNIISFSG